MPRKSQLPASATAEFRRQRLFAPLEIAAFAALIIVVLAVLFPGSSILPRRTPLPHKEGARAPAAAPITGPAPQVATDLEQALAQVERLLADPREPVQRQALMLELEIRRRHAYSYGVATQERREAIDLLRQRLAEVATLAWPARQLAYLATLAQEIGATLLYAELCDRSAEINPTEASRWFARAAQARLSVGDYHGAAESYFKAKRRARTLASRRESFLAGLKALQSGNMLEDALRAAERNLNGLKDDRDTLIFLIKLALAANRPDIADHYAKRLMRLSLLRPRQWRHEARRAQWPIGRVLPAAFRLDRAEKAYGRMRPLGRLRVAAADLLSFEAEAYELAYGVFLGNQNIEAAYRVAEAAVRQRPADVDWRLRLAQMATWSGRPHIALEQYVHIAELTRSRTDWDRALQLARQLGDDAAVVRALRARLRERALIEGEWADLVQAYENSGRPEELLALLAAANRSKPQRHLAAHIARVNARLGRIDAALGAYQEIRQRYGTTPQIAIEEANLWLARGDLTRAHDALEAARAGADDLATDYWQLSGDVAWQLQKYEEARAAYTRLQQIDRLSEVGLQRLVVAQTDDTAKAARFAEYGWRKFRRPWFLLQLIDILTRERNEAQLRELYRSLGNAELVLLNDVPAFWLARGAFRQRNGDREGAVQDYLHALRASDDALDIKVDFLWLLIAQWDSDRLRIYLRKWEPEAHGESRLWGPYAAGYYTVADLRRALVYFKLQIDRRRDDYLWLVNYAQVLEDAGHRASALRVRRYVWQGLRARQSGRTLDEQTMQRLEVHARLALAHKLPEESRILFRQLARQQLRRGMPDDSDAARQELVLSWLLSTEQYEAARVWLWQNYGRQLAGPAGMELSLALAENDIEGAEQLLLERYYELPRYERVEAEQRTGHLAWARRDAFESLAVYDEDDVAHEFVTTTMLDRAHYARLRLGKDSQSALERSERGVDVRAQLSNAFGLMPYWTDFRQKGADPNQLTGVPPRDRELGLLLSYQRYDAFGGVALFRRDALSDFNGARLHYGTAGRLGSLWRLQLNDSADDTSGLLIAGVKDQASVLVTYDLGRREYASGQLALQKFYSQERERISDGAYFDWELGYRMRTEYPDLTFRLSGVFQRYQPVSGLAPASMQQVVPGGNADVGFFIPEDFNIYQVSVLIGEAYREPYTRAWRAYGTFGLLHNTSTGNGYDIDIGIGGSVLGPDRLSFYYSLSRGGTGVDELTRQYGLRYQYFFGRVR